MTARRRLSIGGLAVLMWVRVDPALAHVGGAPPGPGDFWAAWSLDPLVVTSIVAGAALYAVGVRRAWAKAGRGRGVTMAQVAAVAGGTLAVFAALIWPLDALGDALFVAHTAQHMVLMAVAAPLLVLGSPIPAVLRALPLRWRRGAVATLGWRTGRWLGAWLGSPAVALLVQTGVVLAWLAPAALSAALRNDFVHAIMHGSIFAAGLLFWTAVLRARRRGAGIVTLLVATKLSGMIGALLAFSPRPLYPDYGTFGAAWGVSLLEDQQLGGILVMIGGGMMYMLAALVLLGRWLNRDGRAPPLAVAGASASVQTAE